MSAVSNRTAEVRRPGTREIIVDFSPAEVRAPFLLRCGALLIDYIIIVAIPVIGLLLSRYTGNDGVKLLNDGMNSAGWFIAVLVGLSNMLLLPMFTGQTVGKMFTGLRMVNMDGSAPSIRQIAARQTVGYLVTLLTVGLGFLISCLSANGRALHDYLTGTMVIYADRRLRP
ncbi:MAG: RDD family protein [Blastocatellia bacterium]|nr:RDD family protein [Blastocatellia bacterium]